MSLKKLTYSFFCFSWVLLQGCTDKSNSYSYFIQLDRADEINQQSKIFNLGVEVGTVSLVTIHNNQVLIKIDLHQDNLLFTDSQLSIDKLGSSTSNIILKNNSLTNPLAINDTLIQIAVFSQPIQSKPLQNPINKVSDLSGEISEVDQQRIDSLKTKVEHLSNLLDEINGSN